MFWCKTDCKYKSLIFKYKKKCDGILSLSAQWNPKDFCLSSSSKCLQRKKLFYCFAEQSVFYELHSENGIINHVKGTEQTRDKNFSSGNSECKRIVNRWKRGRKKFVRVCHRYVYIHVKIHLLKISGKLITSNSKPFITHDSFFGQTAVGVTSKRAGEWTVFVRSFPTVIVTVPFSSSLSSPGPAKLSRRTSTLLWKH